MPENQLIPLLKGRIQKIRRKYNIAHLHRRRQVEKPACGSAFEVSADQASAPLTSPMGKSVPMRETWGTCSKLKAFMVMAGT